MTIKFCLWLLPFIYNVWIFSLCCIGGLELPQWLCQLGESWWGVHYNCSKDKKKGYYTLRLMVRPFWFPHLKQTVDCYPFLYFDVVAGVVLEPMTFGLWARWYVSCKPCWDYKKHIRLDCVAQKCGAWACKILLLIQQKHQQVESLLDSILTENDTVISMGDL